MDKRNKLYQYVINDLVGMTKITRNKERFYFRPYYEYTGSKSSLHPYTSKEGYTYEEIFLPYCKTHYGLTDDEVSYIWDQFMDIMKDKTYRI